MREFEYRAVDSTGQILVGGIYAPDLQQAKNSLRAKGLIILDIREKSKPLLSIKHLSSLLRRGIDERELYSLFRELSILLRSGLTLDRALAILIDSVPTENLRKTLEAIQQGIREGRSVTQAFSEANFLPPLLLSMISAGEAIGKLASAFENVAEYYKFRINFRNELKSALAYPVFLIIASLITIFIVFRFILPRFFGLFADLTLPLPAKILYTTGLFVSKIKWYYLPIIILLLWLIFKTDFLKNLREKIFQYIIKLPILQRFARDLDLARFSHSMYSMLKSGIDFIDALYLSKNIVLNKNLQSFLDYAILEIRKGMSISDAFKNAPYITPIYYNMLKVGEESGNLKEIFWELYTMHEENFRNNIKRILALIEPAIITLTGIFIGLIVISIILTVINAGVIKF